MGKQNRRRTTWKKAHQQRSEAAAAAAAAAAGSLLAVSSSTELSDGHELASTSTKKHRYLRTLAAGVLGNDPTVQFKCTMEMWRLLFGEEPPVQAVIDAGVVPRCVEFLQRDDYPGLQCAAGGILTNISGGTSDQTKVVVDAGCIPIFVRLLKSRNVDIREQAVWALGAIAGASVSCRDLVLQAGPLKPLLSLMRRRVVDLSLLRVATETLLNLCNRKPGPCAKQFQPALPILARLISIRDEEVVADACQTLAYLCELPDSERIIGFIVEESLRPRLVELLLHASPAIRNHALLVIGSIPRGNELQTQCVIDANDALPGLRRLLSSPKTDIRRRACLVLSTIIAGNKKQVQAVIDGDIIPPLIRLLLTEAEVGVRKEAAWAFAHAIRPENSHHIEYLVKQGCIQPLCDFLLVSDSDDAVLAVLKGLSNILRFGVDHTRRIGNRNQMDVLICEAGGLEKIKALLRLRSDAHEINTLCTKILAILEMPGFVPSVDPPKNGCWVLTPATLLSGVIKQELFYSWFDKSCCYGVFSEGSKPIPCFDGTVWLHSPSSASTEQNGGPTSRRDIAIVTQSGFKVDDVYSQVDASRFGEKFAVCQADCNGGVWALCPTTKNESNLCCVNHRFPEGKIFMKGIPYAAAVDAQPSRPAPGPTDPDGSSNPNPVVSKPPANPASLFTPVVVETVVSPSTGRSAVNSPPPALESPNPFYNFLNFFHWAFTPMGNDPPQSVTPPAPPSGRSTLPNDNYMGPSEKDQRPPPSERPPPLSQDLYVEEEEGEDEADVGSSTRLVASATGGVWLLVPTIPQSPSGLPPGLWYITTSRSERVLSTVHNQAFVTHDASGKGVWTLTPSEDDPNLAILAHVAKDGKAEEQTVHIPVPFASVKDICNAGEGKGVYFAYATCDLGYACLKKKTTEIICRLPRATSQIRSSGKGGIWAWCSDEDQSKFFLFYVNQDKTIREHSSSFPSGSQFI